MGFEDRRARVAKHAGWKQEQRCPYDGSRQKSVISTMHHDACKSMINSVKQISGDKNRFEDAHGLELDSNSNAHLMRTGYRCVNQDERHRA